MKLLIEIPKELFDKCKQWTEHGVASTTEQLVANGTPVYEHEKLKGEWIKTDGNSFECPFCHRLFDFGDNYCGFCGMDMRKPNCVTCDHFGNCEGCEKRNEE